MTSVPFAVWGIQTPTNAMNEALQPAFLLHHRPFRDSSVIAEFFTPDWGRVPAVVKGARGASQRMRQMAASLQAFQHLQISLRGKGELKTLISIEPDSSYRLNGHHLYAALYLNELTLRLLHRSDPHPMLWSLYQSSLAALSESEMLEPVLRRYELGLLEQLGYGVVFDSDASSGAAIVANERYCFEAERGFVLQSGLPHYAGQVAFLGEELMQLAERADIFVERGQWSPAELRILKRVCRLALAPLLGDRPLRSRELFTGKSS